MTAPAAPVAAPIVKSKTLGVLALVFGLVALAMTPVPILNNIGIILGIAAVVIGAIGIAKSSRGMSIAGIGCAVAGIALSLVLQAQWSAQLDQIGHDLDNASVPTAPAPAMPEFPGTK